VLVFSAVCNRNTSGGLAIEKRGFFRSNLTDINDDFGRSLPSVPQASQMLDTTLKTAVHRETSEQIRHDGSSFIYENQARKVSRWMMRSPPPR